MYNLNTSATAQSDRTGLSDEALVLTIALNTQKSTNSELWFYVGGLFNFIEKTYVSNLALVVLNIDTTWPSVVSLDSIYTAHIKTESHLLKSMYGTDGVVTSFAWITDSVVAVGGIFTRFGGLPCAGLCFWDAEAYLGAPSGHDT